MKKLNLNSALAAAVKAARAAGKLMRDNLRQVKKVNLSTSHDVKLELDVRCQKLIERQLASAFPGVAFLGEEGDTGNFSGEFRWVVDPIDGTRLYANRIPTFGISIGLLKNLRPWIGVVYFPVLNELFYCDGKNTYHVQNAFSNKQKKRKIVSIDQKISSQTIFFCNDNYFRKYSFNDTQFHVMIQACAVVNLLWPAIGRGCGCFLRSSLWDFAGSWPIFRSAGLDLRRVRDGKLLGRLDTGLFKREPKPWELQEHYLLSSRRNFKIIKSKITEVSP